MASSIPLVSSLMTDAPSGPPLVGVDQGTQDIINAGNKRAGRSLGEFQDEANQGLQQASALKQSDQAVDQQAAGKSVDPNMLKAIRNQYQTSADSYLGQEKAKNDINAAIYKGDLLHRQAQMGLSIQGARTQQYKFMADAYAQQEYARAAFVNTLFQTADVAMGIYAGKKGFQKQQQQPNPNVGGFNAGQGMQLNNSPEPAEPSAGMGGMSDNF